MSGRSGEGSPRTAGAVEPDGRGAPDPEALAELARVLGEDAVLTEATARAVHERPWRGPLGRAAAVLRPADVAGVREVVAWAVRHRVVLVPQGANTGLVGAGVPDGSGTQVVLSLARLDRVREIDPIDRIVIAEAGVTLSALDAALAPHGLELPIDLSADPSVGGLIATNAGGSRMLRHGDVRRLTLGVEVVLPDRAATLVSELEALRKDNARTHLRDLIVASGGDLTVVTAAAFEVVPRARARAAALVRVPDVRTALALTVALEHHLGPELAAAELIGASTLERIVRHVPEAAGGIVAATTVLVELATHRVDRDAEAALASALAGIAEDGAARGVATIDDAAVVPSAAAWRLRHAASEAVARDAAEQGALVVALDVSVRRSRLPDLLAAARAAVVALAPDVAVHEFGHLGDGGMHLLLVVPGPAPDGPPTAASVREGELRDVVYRQVRALGGSISAEHGRGPTVGPWLGTGTRDRDARAEPDPRGRIEEGLHDLFDPFRLLGNPGDGTVARSRRIAEEGAP